MNTRRLPRTVRLDSSDVSAFELAAAPGEWAVAGGFAFLDDTDRTLTGKRRLAFSAFLGVESFGWSTFVLVASATDADCDGAADALAGHFVAHLGAPSHAAALDAARLEVAFAESLCGHPVGTLLTVSRRFEGDGVVEHYATVTPEDPLASAHAAPIDIFALAGGALP